MRLPVRIGTAALVPLVLGCSTADGSTQPFGAGTDAGVDASLPDTAVAVSADAAHEPPVADVAPEALSAQDAEPHLPPDCDSDVYHQYACCVFAGVNEFRKQHGVGLLDYVWDPETTAVAQWYTELKRDAGVFAHGVDGRKCGSRMSAFDVSWSSCGENLARNTYDNWLESCQTVVVQWANSTAGHREAMLEDKWTYAGVGVAQGDGWWWVTMNFREP
ncbi:MAG: CAP domain-containing protein [Myxococcota bacterium]